MSKSVKIILGLGIAIIMGLCILAISLPFTNTSFGAQHCINVNTDGDETVVTYSSPDSLGAIIIMLDFKECVPTEARWGKLIPASRFSFIDIDHNRIIAGCFPVDPSLPSGQNIYLLNITLDRNGCNPDTFTNAIGSRTAMVKTDACGVPFNINFTYTDVSDDEDESGVLPSKFGMGIYPNPFNPSTVIKYVIPVECRVRISVYNMLGQKIEDLIDGTQVFSPGVYMINWNPSKISSGIYFLRMVSPRSSITKKVVLMK